MPEYKDPEGLRHIVTRADVSQQAMQFEPYQDSVDAIQEWLNMYDADVKLTWTGTVATVEFEAADGFLILTSIETGHEMEAFPGDWIVKSSRNTFYTIRAEDFDEIFMVID